MNLSTEAQPLFDQARIAQTAADYLTLGRIGREMMETCERNGDRLGAAWGQYFIGAAHFQRVDPANAARAYKAAQEMFEKIGNREGIARSMLGIAAVALDHNVDVAEARRIYDIAVPIVRELGDKDRLGIVLGNSGEIARMEGDYKKALKLASEAVTLFREAQDHASVGWQYTSMGHYYLLMRNYPEAVGSMHKAWPELCLDPIPLWFAWYFDVWFITLAALNKWDIAAKILGFVNKYRDDHNAPRRQGIYPWFTRPVERLSEHLGHDPAHDLLLDGEHLTLEQAHELVKDVTA